MDLSYAARIEEGLTCCVCTELFIDPHTPKDLNCPHVVCQICLNYIVEEEAIVCPQCSTTTRLTKEGVAALKTNLSIRNLAETHQKHLQKRNLEQCGNPSLRSAPGNVPTCPDHDEEMFFYCFTCDALVCQACISSSHKPPRHNVKHVEMVHSDQIKNMSVLMDRLEKDAAQCQIKSELSGKAEQDILSSIKRVEEMIDLSLANAHEHGSSLKAEFRRKKESELEECRKRTKMLHTQAKDIKVAIANAKAVMKESHTFVKQHKTLLDQLKAKQVSLTFSALVLVCTCAVVMFGRQTFDVIVKLAFILVKSATLLLSLSNKIMANLCNGIYLCTCAVLMFGRQTFDMIVKLAFILVESAKLLPSLPYIMANLCNRIYFSVWLMFMLYKYRDTHSKEQILLDAKKRIRKLEISSEFEITGYMSAMASNKTGSILALGMLDLYDTDDQIHICEKLPGGQYRKLIHLNLSGLTPENYNSVKAGAPVGLPVAIDSAGNYWVALRDRCVHVFSMSGEYQRKAISYDSDISGISITQDDTVILGDSLRPSITVHSPDGTRLKTIDTLSIKPSFTTMITAINNTHVAICTLYLSSRIVVFDLESERETLSFGFKSPIHAICYDKETDCLLILREADATIEQYSLTTGRMVARIIAKGLDLYGPMTFMGDGMLAVGTYKKVKIFKATV